LRLPGLLVLVAQPVRFVQLGLQRRRPRAAAARSVDVERDAATARALGDLVAPFFEAARVEHGRREAH
jgi:hypothetical protein